MVNPLKLRGTSFALLSLSLMAHGLAAAATGTIVFRPSAGEQPGGLESALVIGHTLKAPTVDGVIGEREWAHAGFGGFDLDGDRSKRTVIYAQYDARHLYLAFRCLEPQTDRIAARYGPGKVAPFAPDKTGDTHCYYDDSIEVFISLDAQQKTVYQFIANTIGGQRDTRYDLPESDVAYTSNFRSAANVGTGEWTIELSIPLSVIGVTDLRAGVTSLRVNFGRSRTVSGTVNAAWQDFWAWRGSMPQAFFAAPSEVSIGNVRYGRRFLGKNWASVRVRNGTKDAAKVRLRSTCTQAGRSEDVSKWIAIQPGKQADLRVGYTVQRGSGPFDLTMTVEGAGNVTLAEKRLTPVPPITAATERHRYGPVDGPMVVFFHLHLNPESLPHYAVKCSLTAGGKTAALATAALSELRGEARFLVAEPAETTYAVDVAVEDRAGRNVYATQIGPVIWSGTAGRAPAGRAGRLPLKLDVFKGVQRPAGPWPVTVGVPFGRGVLTSAANVRLLDPDGAEVPAEVSVPATWDRARTSVRWLHVKFLANLKYAGKDYALEYGIGTTRAPFVSKLKASDANDSITVDTGRLKLVVRKRPFRFIESAWLDRDGDGTYAAGEQVIVPGPASGLLVETADGRRFRSDASLDWPDVEKVELESIAPVEAAVRAEGWHKIVGRGKPERMMKYVVRIIATADTSLLRVFHTFILTEDEETQYRQVTLGLSLPDDDTAVMDHQTRRAHRLSPGAEVALLQVDHDAYRLQERSPERGRAVLSMQAGNRSEGWLLVQRKGWGVTLVTRDFWQNYAKGYEVRRSGLTLCPWPKGALTPLSFRPEDVIAPIFVKKLCYTSNGGRIGDGGNYTTYTYAVGTKPMGVSKTHEYLLDFATAPSTARSRMVQQLLNDPPLLVVPPKVACATEAMDKLHPFEEGKYALEESGFKAMLRRLEYGKPEHRHWGLVNFGESYQQTSDTGLIYVYRTYQNAGYGIVNDFYRGYLRSGDRDWFRYAVRRTRHSRDLDHCHYGPMSGGQTEYDTLNWGTQFAVQTFWTHRLFLLQDWYVTGDRRSWDVFCVACHGTLKLQPGSGPKDDRHWFNQPKELIHMYEATWDPRFLEMAKAIVDGILLAKEKAGPGKWPRYSVAMNDYLQPSLIVYHRFTREPRVLEYLKAHFTHLKGKQNYATNKAQDVAACLYWVTGEVKWLDAVGGYEAMRDYMRLFDTQHPPPAGGLRRMIVSEAVNGWMRTWPTKSKQVIYYKFVDKGFHHTFERLWYFMAAVDDAKRKGLLKPYKGPNNPWSEPIWDENYWKTVSPEKAKRWGWR